MDAAATTAVASPGLLRTVRAHWPEYLIEGWALGTFMVSAGLVTTALEAPASPLRAVVTDPDLRRLLVGLAMGLTAIALIYSPWGRRSGAHMNPAVTLTFWRLGKVGGADAACYALAQLAGGTLGVVLVAGALGRHFTASPVSWVATVPGAGGTATAFAAELAISAGLMATVLAASARPRLAPWTGVLCGALVALFIAVEAPLSGMSMNPARTLASALPGGPRDALWIYLAAPTLGMLAAAALHNALGGRVACAKLRHTPAERCIHCGHEPSSTHGRTG
jgi:aquaporin Z